MNGPSTQVAALRSQVGSLGRSSPDSRSNPGTDDLPEIMQMLTRIQDLTSLYPTIAGILLKRPAVQHLSVFIYHRESRSLNLAYSHGIGIPNDAVFSLDEATTAGWVHEAGPLGTRGLLGHAPFGGPPETDWPNQLKADVCFPLILSGKVFGLLFVGPKADGGALGDGDLDFLRKLAVQASICIGNCLLNEEREDERKRLHRTLNNLSLLYRIGQAMTRISDLKNLLQYILSQAIRISRAQKASIMLWDNDSRLSVRVLTGMTDQAQQGRINSNEVPCKRFKPGEGVAGKVFQTGKPVYINKARESAEFSDPAGSFVDSIACMPMAVYGEVLGVINLTNKQDPAGFTEDEILLLKAVADQAAIAVNKAQLWDLAFTDSLTGLYDRRYFKVKLHEELRRAKRYQRPLSIIMADLDRFKDVNDTYGHAEGDRVLKAIGSAMAKQIRDIDVIARYGGDEYIMFVPEKDTQDARRLAERLKERIARESAPDQAVITASFGIAAYPEDGTKIEDLIYKADRAMYSAKQRGRNRIESYDDVLPHDRSS